jgi:hypothetical protein
MFGWIKKNLFRKKPGVDPYDQCVIEFIEECKRQGCVPASYDHQARSVQFGPDAGGAKFHLGNLFATWLPLDQQGRAEAIAWFVRSVGESAKHAEISPETLPDQLMPAIRARALIGTALLQNWIAGAPTDATTEIAWLPFAGDLAAIVVRDKPLKMAPLTRANLTFADIQINRAMSRAMTNLRARMPAAIFEPVGNGVFGCYNFQDHQSAFLLLEPGKDYALPPIEGAPVAIVPSRNLFYLTGSANEAGLNKLLDLAARAGQMAYFCSSTMLEWDGNRWTEFRFREGDDRAVRQQEIALARLAADYNSQKQLLDQYHQKCGLEIFVAQLMPFRKNDSPIMFSFTALASGVTCTLLPCADRLSFVRQIVDPKTGLAEKTPKENIVQAVWADAMDIAGDLFEPVEHVYPPRFRVRGFPDDDNWGRLNAVAVR